MPAPLPGTKHCSTLDRDERPILEAMRDTPGVRKIETGPFTAAPSKRRRLRLAPAHGRTVQPVFIAWLFIGSGKRHVTLCPEHGVALPTVGRALALALARYDVHVEYPQEEQGMEQVIESLKVHGSGLTVEQQWACAERVYDGVQKVRALEEREALLEMELEDVRIQKKEARQKVFDLMKGE